MTDINFIAVIVSAVLALVLSGVWYTVFGGTIAKLQRGKKPDANMPAWKTYLELLRSAVVATVLAYLFLHLGVDSVLDALFYALLLWLAFPVVLLAGSIMHEKVSAKLAVIHAGDWLAKLTLIAVILAILQ